MALDWDQIAKEEQFDGYYALVTSELHMSNREIIDTYRGLWEIEETFQVTKGALEARPVYVSRNDRIEAHFLACFLALVILRLLQWKTGRKHSPRRWSNASIRLPAPMNKITSICSITAVRSPTPSVQLLGLISHERDCAGPISKNPGRKQKVIYPLHISANS